MAEIHDPYEALLESSRRRRARALADPMENQMMFVKPVPGCEPSHTALEISRETFDSLGVVVKRAMTAALIAEAPPIETTMMIGLPRTVGSTSNCVP